MWAAYAITITLTFQNLINSSLVHNLPVPQIKIHPQLWAMLFTHKQINKRQSKHNCQQPVMEVIIIQKHCLMSEIWTNLNTNHGLLWLYQGQEREDWRDHDSATSHWSSVDKTTSPLLATHVHESVLYGLTLQKYIQAHNLVKNRHHLELTNIMSQNINYGANNIQAKTLIVADKT